MSSLQSKGQSSMSLSIFNSISEVMLSCTRRSVWSTLWFLFFCIDFNCSAASAQRSPWSVPLAVNPAINAATASNTLTAISGILNNVEAIRSSSESQRAGAAPASFDSRSAFFNGPPARTSANPSTQSQSLGGQGAAASFLGAAAEGTNASSFLNAANAFMALGSTALSATQLAEGLRSRNDVTRSENENNPSLIQAAMDIATCDPSRQGVCCVAKSFCVPEAKCQSDISPSNLLEIANAVPKCSCPNGYYGNGRTKGTGCTNINECQTGEAGCEHLCEDKIPGFSCACHEGYKLLPDGKHCEDIDECADMSSGCTGTCRNTVGGFECGCSEGYRMRADKRTCEDIDECLSNAGKGPCDYRCHNTAGSFICSCPEGFKLDMNTKTRCIDRNECVDGLYPDGRPACSSDGSQLCSNAPGSYACNCRKGYRQVSLSSNSISSKTTPIPTEQLAGLHPESSDSSDQRRLDISLLRNVRPLIAPLAMARNSEQEPRSAYVDFRPLAPRISEPLVLSEQSNEVNGQLGGYDALASLQLGNPTIQAASFDYIPAPAPEISSTVDYGWLSCVDIDECEILPRLEGVSTCPSPNSHCVNTPGGYKCDCLPGFSLGDDGQCEDINECTATEVIPGRHSATARYPCEHFCRNKVGSYECSCSRGFKLADGGRCEDVDECADANGGCSQICTNVPGSYQCGCNRGFQYVDGSCVDIDECHDGSHKCSDTCINTVGSYRCECSQSDQVLAGDARTCLSRSDCRLAPGCQHGMICEQGPAGAYRCVCPPKFMEKVTVTGRKCVDIDECVVGYPTEGQNPCPQSSAPCCLNSVGGFVCIAKQRQRGVMSLSKVCAAPSIGPRWR